MPHKNDPLIIGITGPRGSGKTTAAFELYQAHQDQGIKVMELAWPIKLGLSIMLQIPLEYFSDPWLKEQRLDEFGYPFSPRHAMQTLGTEWRDMVDPLLWIKALDRRLTNLQGEEDEPISIVLVPDVRFEHQAEWIVNSKHGVVWEIYNPHVAWDESHSSEAGIPSDLISAYIFNDPALVGHEEIRDQAINLLEQQMTDPPTGS